MNRDVYVRLAERMNLNPVKHPVVEPILNLLKELFNEKEATLAAEFPVGAHTAKALSKLLGRDEVELERLLAEMDYKGLIFVAKNKGGEKEYSVLPFEPGLNELQFLKGKEDAETKKYGQLLSD